ncbi:MAG: O-acetylhomoserine aminocarboxypropyltransferase/cysteine synthase, partial [Treponema sp.]|nr:O-acetylhomoserine aminocarboxypropyltransferase/cysteine synthase [Treponema sp.]
MGNKYKFETQCLHAGYEPKNGEPGTVPIVQSTTFKFDSCEHVAELFDLPTEFMYSRFANPTCDAVEKKIATLEGGVAAMLTSSGQAASLISILNVCTSGDSFIASSAIYGGTINLFCFTLKKLGIECIQVPADSSYKEIIKAFKPNTKAVFGETIANPALNVFDFEVWARVAHEKNVPLIIDNTFATPVLCRPFEHGADIVVHSTTKYMDGHAVQGGGVIVDSGNFDWEKAYKATGFFEDLCTGDASYHGLV